MLLSKASQTFAIIRDKQPMSASVQSFSLRYIKGLLRTERHGDRNYHRCVINDLMPYQYLEWISPAVIVDQK